MAIKKKGLIHLQCHQINQMAIKKGIDSFTMPSNKSDGYEKKGIDSFTMPSNKSDGYECISPMILIHGNLL